MMTNPSPPTGCEIASGVLVDPYSGRRIEWVKNGPQLVDIDHVVALGDAWVSGAANDRTWDTDTRRALANDPLNVMAVDGRLNRPR